MLDTHAKEPLENRKKQREIMQRDADKREREQADAERMADEKIGANIAKHVGKVFTVGKDGRARVYEDQEGVEDGKVRVSFVKVPSGEEFAEYDDGEVAELPKREVLAAIRAEPEPEPDEKKPGEGVRRTLDAPFEPTWAEAVPPRLFDAEFDKAEDPETVKANLEKVERVGLNKWPKKGPVATEILGEHKDTEAKFSFKVPGDPKPRQEWSYERKLLHDQIIDALLRRRQPNEKGELAILDPEGEYLAAPTGKPRALFMGGGTASGKSTALKLDENKDVQPEDAVLIDPDEIKGLLPEYGEMVERGERYAASAVHEESSALAKRLQVEAMRRGLNVIVDGTGDSQVDADDPESAGKLRKKVEAFHGAQGDATPEGYDVSMFYVNAPTEIALVRATTRAMREGRWVPKPEIESIHRGVSQRWQREVLAMIEEGVIIDARGYQTSGTPTRMFHLDENGKLVVLEQDLYDAFLAKADEAPIAL